MDYSRFNVEDFVADEYFIGWVKSPTEESNAFWNAWLSKHPKQRPSINEARSIILLLDFREERPREGKFLEIWENIIREDHKNPELMLEPDDKPVLVSSVKWYYKIAASVLLCVFAGIAWQYYGKRAMTISTGYGEAQTLFLPDSTKVTLNSNSTITYTQKEFTDKKREVWLTGEAIFAVVKKTNHQNFLVHTNQLVIEVLGTKFDVNSRRGKTTVVLEEGKVKLDPAAGDRSPLIMQPGEFVEISERNQSPTRKKVNTDNYMSWKNNRLVFDNTSLLEIAQLLEDNYGYEVVFEDAAIEKRKFTGSASSENIQVLFQKLSIVFNLEIQQDQKTLKVRYNKENPKQLSPS